jgi:glycosyltransferase involved in cell wall biosynthesis
LRILPRIKTVLANVQVVHFHDIDLLPWLAAISLVKPVVYDVHENYAEEILGKDWIPAALRAPLSFMVRWGQFILASLIRNIVLVAPSQEKDFSHKRFHKIYLYNYASLGLLGDVKDDYLERQDCVIFIGSQHINNGSLLLLDVVDAALKRVPKVRFIATDRFANPVFRKQVLDEIDRRGLTGKISLVPNVKPHQLMAVLNRATIGISPNLRVPQQIKGIHTKLFEYMAAGLPMVVSDLPHQVEVVESSGTGILAQPEDAESFAAAIEALVVRRDDAMQMGRRGQQTFLRSYCYESQADHLLSFYRNVLQNR